VFGLRCLGPDLGALVLGSVGGYKRRDLCLESVEVGVVPGHHAGVMKLEGSEISLEGGEIEFSLGELSLEAAQGLELTRQLVILG